MGKQSGSNRSIASTSYPEFQLPAVQKLISESNRLYDTGGPQMFPGSRVAPLTQDEQYAQEHLRFAAAPAAEIPDWSQRQFAFNLNEGRDPATNPYFKSALSSAVAPITQQLLTQALPNIRNQSLLAGTYGGSRQGIAEAQAVERASRVAGDIGNQMANQNYLNSQQIALDTMRFGPSLQQQWAIPAQFLSAAGQQTRDYQQALLDEQANRYEYSQRLPWQNLAEFGNMIRSPFGSNAVSAFEPARPSTAAQVGAAALSVPALIQMLQGLWR